ncbi:MAG: RNA polymerase sigma factor [Myxococcota bacterium]
MKPTPLETQREGVAPPQPPRGLVTPREVAEAGARFVPQTLRYLGVPDVSLMDAVQDVFVVALRRLDDFEGRSSLRTWLYGICVRIAHDHRRRAKSSREALVAELPEVPVVAAQDAALEQSEWRRALGALLERLDEHQRAVFVLYEIQGLSMKEVAEALGCPLQTAYFRHKSATSRVLEAFQRLERAS